MEINLVNSASVENLTFQVFNGSWYEIPETQVFPFILFAPRMDCCKIYVEYPNPNAVKLCRKTVRIMYTLKRSHRLTD